LTERVGATLDLYACRILEDKMGAALCRLDRQCVWLVLDVSKSGPGLVAAIARINIDDQQLVGDVGDVGVRPLRPPCADLRLVGGRVLGECPYLWYLGSGADREYPEAAGREVERVVEPSNTGSISLAMSSSTRLTVREPLQKQLS
jgi:hypothetical protein